MCRDKILRYRSIHEMSTTSQIFDGNELDFLRDRPTLLRAQRGKVSCALFAPCGCGAFETEYSIDDG